MKDFLLAARAQGLGACMTGWGSHGGELQLGAAVGVPEDRMIAGHIAVGWPRGKHGLVRRRALAETVNLDRWDEPAGELAARSPEYGGVTTEAAPARR